MSVIGIMLCVLSGMCIMRAIWNWGQRNSEWVAIAYLALAMAGLVAAQVIR